MIDDRLVATLKSTCGRRHVLTGGGETRRFRLGYRTGGSDAAIVVRPGSLVELWRAALACVEADVSIVMQAANTGLTGGSTPNGAEYPGGVVVINTTRITGQHLLDDGEQVVCLPGTTLYALERALRPHGREPHSVIGSSCIGATVVGGVCNNSGGSLVQRGPAYTEHALFGRVTEKGTLELIDHLGLNITGDPETMLAKVEAGDFKRDAVHTGRASDPDYRQHVCGVDEATPARFNNDPRRLFEAAGSAGKLIVFATRHDSFPMSVRATVFYCGTNDPARLGEVRRCMLSAGIVPIAGEYMDRACFDIADRYGKDVFIAIRALGTDRLPALFAIKARVDALTSRVGIRAALADRIMQTGSRMLKDHLPARLRRYNDRFEHHLLLKVDGVDADATRAILDDVLARDWFECSKDEGERAFLHRFVAAGAAIRYRAVHPDEVAEIVALDIALPRNTLEWREVLPEQLQAGIIHAMYYGHFFCHVFHQDYIVRAGYDPVKIEHELHDLLDARGAEYPAEHNVGHLYAAKPALAAFYRSIDPRNQLNPGIGQTTRERWWGEPPGSPQAIAA